MDVELYRCEECGALYWNTHVCGLEGCEHVHTWEKVKADGVHGVCVVCGRDLGVISELPLA